MLERLRLSPDGPGLHDFTAQVEDVVARSGVEEGLCTLFIPHTSASLLIQENADPSARRDLEAWLDRLVPEDDPLYTHRQEGPDDMPAHVKAALTATSVAIPVDRGELVLGTWQGLYLWEHRREPGMRTVVVQIA